MHVYFNVVVKKENIIEHIKQYYPHIEIIAGGGISEKKDIEHYIELGADHISLGTVCFNPVKLGRLL